MKKSFKKLIVVFTCLTILLSVSMVQVYGAGICSTIDLR